MRLASWSWGGRDDAGMVSADGRAMRVRGFYPVDVIATGAPAGVGLIENPFE